MVDLGIFFFDPPVWVFLIPAVSRAEDSCCDVVFQQLFVYHVDNGRDDGFDIFLSINQGDHVIWHTSMLDERSSSHADGYESGPGLLTCSELQELLEVLNSGWERSIELPPVDMFHPLWYVRHRLSCGIFDLIG